MIANHEQQYDALTVNSQAKSILVNGGPGSPGLAKDGEKQDHDGDPNGDNEERIKHVVPFTWLWHPFHDGAPFLLQAGALPSSQPPASLAS
jgi:hypothetical protein